MAEQTKEERRRAKEQHRLDKERYRLAKLTQTSESTLEGGLTVLCVRFGNKYGREYVERLRNMVARHMTIPYEFACLTDDHHSIEGVRTIYQHNAGYQRGWWHKVHMFDPTLPLNKRVIFFDLDVVIHNNIDKLATTFSNEFLGIHDFNRKFHANWHSMNSSVLAWNHSSQSIIWDEFKKNPLEAQRLPGDQDWIWKLSKGHMKFWPRDWIQSYKWEIRSKEQLTMVNGRRVFKEVDHSIEVHPDCCVTVFHGDPKPEDVKDKFVVDNWR